MISFLGLNKQTNKQKKQHKQKQNKKGKILKF